MGGGAARRQNSPRQPCRLTEGAGTAKQHGKSPAEPKETRWLDKAHKGNRPALEQVEQNHRRSRQLGSAWRATLQ